MFEPTAERRDALFYQVEEWATLRNHSDRSLYDLTGPWKTGKVWREMRKPRLHPFLAGLLGAFLP